MAKAPRIKTTATSVISVRVSPELRQRIEDAAIKHGLTLGGYVAATLKAAEDEDRAVPRSDPREPELPIEPPPDKALLNELRRIGNNINQIAHAANSGLPLKDVAAVHAVQDLLKALVADREICTPLPAGTAPLTPLPAQPPVQSFVSSGFRYPNRPQNKPVKKPKNDSQNTQKGRSFSGTVSYITHDPNADSRDRVLWAQTLNLPDVEPDAAWRPMLQTYNDRTRLKRESGVDMRGRDNTQPVLHYTLGWRSGQRPDQEQMMEAVRSSLKALKLEEHQAVIAAHSDKDHWHVHVVVNTVHPETGRTAPLKFPQRELQKWRAEYERQHDNGGPAEGNQPEPEPERKRKSLTRSDHLTRKMVLERFERHRTEYDNRHLVERDVLSTSHRAEWDELRRDMRSAADTAIEHTRDRFKGRWRELYEAQRIENKHLETIQHNPIQRAVYVTINSERLGNGAPLKPKEKAELIGSPTRLFKTVETLHKRERGALSQVQTAEVKERLERVVRAHEQRCASIQTRQCGEREALRTEQRAIKRNATGYLRAKVELQLERSGHRPVRMAADAPPLETDRQYTLRKRAEAKAFYQRNAGPEGRARMDFVPTPPPPQPEPPAPKATPAVAPTFENAAQPPIPAPISRAEQIKRDAEAFRARHGSKDFDRDME